MNFKDEFPILQERKISYLDCSYNKLKSLNIHNNTNLEAHIV